MSDFDHIIVGPQARRHNYYALQEYLRRKAHDTGLELAYGGVGMMANEDFIVGLQEGLEAEVGEASAVIMYQCGLEWGRLDMERFEQRVLKEWGKPMRDLNVNFILETWWWPLTAAGWGAWKIDLSRVKQGFIVADIFNSAVAQSLEPVGKPVCHLYAGMLAGSLSVLVRKPLSAIEIQCYAMGEDNCRFLVASDKRVDAAEFWLNEGARAGDILRRLENN
jgi:predicted hydrocarbon binding protein